MCDDRNSIEVCVKIPTDLSSTQQEKWRVMLIDRCIAKMVKVLQKGEIDMRGSCCGHGKSEGDIHLQDGRALLILDKQHADIYYSRKDKGRNLYEVIEGWEKKERKGGGGLID